MPPPTAGPAPAILGRFVIGIVALGAWVWVELTDEHPLLDLRLFKIRTFTLSALVSFVLTVGMFGGMLRAAAVSAEPARPGRRRVGPDHDDPGAADDGR